MNVLINVSERRFHLNNVNIYGKNSLIVYLLTFYLTSMNVLINISERRFHLNNVNIYGKNYGSVNTNGKGFRLRGREIARLC